jgi:hypothetical protein
MISESQLSKGKSQKVKVAGRILPGNGEIDPTLLPN